MAAVQDWPQFLCAPPRTSYVALRRAYADGSAQLALRVARCHSQPLDGVNTRIAISWRKAGIHTFALLS